MSTRKIRTAKTPKDVLLTNLRGEVGEVITTWILMRSIEGQATTLRTDDLRADLQNQQLQMLHLIADKLFDEIVARLSELAEPSSAQLTFEAASLKFQVYGGNVAAFRSFICSSQMERKRNYSISHKRLPYSWSEPEQINITHRVVLRALGMAVRLMKKFDRVALGPASTFLWKEMRKRRHHPLYPPKTAYMLLPYLNLTQEERLQVVRKELAEGRAKLEDLNTLVNGEPAVIKVSKAWGVIFVGKAAIALGTYPLVELTSIETDSGQKN